MTSYNSQGCHFRWFYLVEYFSVFQQVTLKKRKEEPNATLLKSDTNEKPVLCPSSDINPKACIFSDTS